MGAWPAWDGGRPPAPTQATAVADPAHLPLFGWWTGHGDEVGGAFMHTPSVYQRIGYRAVEDRVVLTFSPPGATGR